MRSIGLATALFLVGMVGAAADTAPLRLAQGGSCPASHPVNCGRNCCETGSYCTDNGGCCPRGTWETDDDYCIPDGHPYCGSGKYCDPGDTIVCRGTCYGGAREAVNAGCPVSEHTVCGAPVR